jgi:hypothetical protein
MNALSRTFRDEILRAVLGDTARGAKPANAARLNQLAENMASAAEAKSILCAKGHGSADMPMTALARNVPAASPKHARHGGEA